MVVDAIVIPWDDMLKSTNLRPSSKGTDLKKMSYLIFVSENFIIIKIFTNVTVPTKYMWLSMWKKNI